MRSFMNGRIIFYFAAKMAAKDQGGQLFDDGVIRRHVTFITSN